MEGDHEQQHYDLYGHLCSGFTAVRTEAEAAEHGRKHSLNSSMMALVVVLG